MGDKIQNRLNKIKWKQRNEIQIKRDEERKKKNEERKKKLEKTRIEQKEKKINYIDAKKKWNQILGNSPTTNSASISNQSAKPKIIRNQNKTSKLMKIQNQEDLLKREIEREIERKD